MYTVDTNKLFVPKSLRDRVLLECHGTPFSGRLGFKKTYEIVCRYFWWSALSTTVRHFCRSCEVCQRIKSGSSLPYGLLQPVRVPTLPWESVSMDLVTPDLHICCGFDSVFVVVGRLTKCIVLSPCRKLCLHLSLLNCSWTLCLDVLACQRLSCLIGIPVLRDTFGSLSPLC